ncbi:unnamed protein product [Paramecium sonneborni]|uniref:Uncharacterized protein n=1 Tax=Paramecium sonneborni TaxID=65129 RepID=A0A8S1P4R7_9CILI|nr:unnamed protein product [Paramecium sonneborni]
MQQKNDDLLKKYWNKVSLNTSIFLNTLIKMNQRKNCKLFNKENENSNLRFIQKVRDLQINQKCELSIIFKLYLKAVRLELLIDPDVSYIRFLRLGLRK